MWDSGIVLGKFLEHAVDSGMLLLQGKKVVELGSGCGLVGYKHHNLWVLRYIKWNMNSYFMLIAKIMIYDEVNSLFHKLLENITSSRWVGYADLSSSILAYLCLGWVVALLTWGCFTFGFSCISALLGAQVILTDLPDRLRLLRKNVETNLKHDDMRGSAVVKELIWGDDPDRDLIEPLPDYGNCAVSLLPQLINLLSFSMRSNLVWETLNYWLLFYLVWSFSSYL